MVKHYVVTDANNDLGLEFGDRYVLDETTNSYYCMRTDSEITADGEYTTSTFTRLPASAVEGKNYFELDLSVEEMPVKPEIEETPVEEVIKELEDECPVQEPLVTDIKVIIAFPGCKEGDVFKYIPALKLYVKQTPVDEDEYLNTLLHGSMEAFTVEEVNECADYFEDITVRLPKSKDTIIMKIADLADQKLGLEMSIKSLDNKLAINKTKKQMQIIDKVIEALEWSIGEGRDFIVE